MSNSMPQARKLAYKKIAYIAGPYSAETVWKTKTNIQAAERISAQLWVMGAAVICPHVNSGFFDGLVPYGAFLKGYLEVLSRCDFLVVLPAYEESHGTQKEIDKAKRLGKPVYYIPKDWHSIRKELGLVL